MAIKMECSNCQGENAETGYVELWDGVCPDCGRIVNQAEFDEARKLEEGGLTDWLLEVQEDD